VGDGLTRRHLFGAGAAIGAGALVGTAPPVWANAVAPAAIGPALPGVQHRFLAGITLKPFVVEAPASTVTKVLSIGTFDAYTTSTVGTSYLGTYLDVPNGGRLMSIEFHVRLAAAASAFIALVHLRPTQSPQTIVGETIAAGCRSRDVLGRTRRHRRQRHRLVPGLRREPVRQPPGRGCPLWLRAGRPRARPDHAGARLRLPARRRQAQRRPGAHHLGGERRDRRRRSGAGRRSGCRHHADGHGDRGRWPTTAT
jgi:hypothetical protein